MSEVRREVADSHVTCWICGTSADGVQSAGLPPPPIMATVVDEPLRRPPPRPQVGMPRQFGIGTLMILTAAFAVMFSLMKMLSADPAVFVGISIFVAGIAACQVLLYKGKNPRKASIIGGYVMGGLIFVGVAIVGGFYRRELGWYYFDYWLPTLFFTVLLLGGPFGYLAGCMVAGIFLAWNDHDPEPADDDPFNAIAAGWQLAPHTARICLLGRSFV